MSLDLLPEFERLCNILEGFPCATGPDDDNCAVTKYSTKNPLLYSNALYLREKELKCVTANQPNFDDNPFVSNCELGRPGRYPAGEPQKTSHNEEKDPQTSEGSLITVAE